MPSRFRTWAKANQNRIWAWVIGFGLVLFAIHNPYQPFKEYAFLPVIGLAISLLAVIIVLMDNWRNLDFGSRWVWIPLVCVGGSIAVSGFVNGMPGLESGGELGARITPLFFGAYLFGIYLVARILKEDLFAPFSFAVIVGAIGCVYSGVTDIGTMTGGIIISPTNYDIAAGLLLFGAVVGIWRHRWWLSAVALVGLFFTGAVEGMFGIGVVAVVMLIRRDWGKRLMLTFVVIVVTAGIWFGLGYGQRLYSYVNEQISGTVVEDVGGDRVPFYGLVGRWHIVKDAMSDIQPFGHGYTITHFTNETVHNVPLIVVDQVGVLGAVAWLFITIFCLIKTKWKYAWVAVMALCVFDHFIWTQVAPWWWALVGVSTASTVKSDLIFREAKS